MVCRDVENYISAYIENELDKDRHALVSRHLQQCRHCRLLKERTEAVLAKLPELEEEIPFFLKNRLLNIPEPVKVRKTRVFLFPKWVAAGIGTIVLFMNLFYFTNIYPSANREVHSLVSSIQKFIVKTGGLFEKIKESKDFLLFTFFNKKSLEIKDQETKKELDKKDVKGGTYG